MTTSKHEVPEELLSSLLANYKKPEDLIGETGDVRRRSIAKPDLVKLIRHLIAASAVKQDRTAG